MTRQALVVGAGPAGLMAADTMAEAGMSVTVVDRMPSPARKFLMAGKSGLNLTKVQDMPGFLAGFGAVPDSFVHAVQAFGPEAIQDWARDLGQEVFAGTTGRVFPRAMKASPLLRAWLARLETLGVRLERRWEWVGMDGGAHRFETSGGVASVSPDVAVLAMGGASWRKLGSDGAWAERVDGVVPFQPANVGFEVVWSEYMRPFFGVPVKSVRLRAGAAVSRGEWVITARGIEGGGVYEVSAAVRDGAALEVDLLPDVSAEALAAKVASKRAKQSQAQFMKTVLRMPPVKRALFQEFGRGAGASLKAVPIVHQGPLPMDGAISTAGGLGFAALDGWMLRDAPGVFAAGEMLDWEAPTGGYLISGCLASGRAAGAAAVAWCGTTA